MAIGQVTKFDKFQSNIMKDANRQWDDPTSGNVMFVLATKDYTPSAAHETLADIGANYITSGNGAPIAAVGLEIDDVTEAGAIFFDSGAADFGANVTITAKYLICILPTTPGAVAATDKLLWYVDLDTASTTAEASSTDSIFKINPPVNGWIKI